MLDERVALNFQANTTPIDRIGSGQGCDGQILVTTDLLGWSHGQVPKFVKPYLNLNKLVLMHLEVCE